MAQKPLDKFAQVAANPILWNLKKDASLAWLALTQNVDKILLILT
jgi:hypothetical protein